MRSANPTLSDKIFLNAPRAVGGEGMSIGGTVGKTGLLLTLLTASAFWMWTSPLDPTGFLMIAVIVGFIVAMVTIFKKEWSPVTAPVYALVEGVVLGGLSELFEMRFPGIVIQAVFLTFGTLMALLMVYQSGMVKVTDNFRLGLLAATGGIALIYIATLALSFFGIQIPYIHDSGPIGIGFSVFVVIIAALNLVLDFDFIEKGAQQGAPKYMEWYGAFGLIVTLIWLYIEFLRLLSKLRGGNSR